MALELRIDAAARRQSNPEMWVILVQTALLAKGLASLSPKPVLPGDNRATLAMSLAGNQAVLLLAAGRSRLN